MLSSVYVRGSDGNQLKSMNIKYKFMSLKLNFRIVGL